MFPRASLSLLALVTLGAALTLPEFPLLLPLPRALFPVTTSPMLPWPLQSPLILPARPLELTLSLHPLELTPSLPLLEPTLLPCLPELILLPTVLDLTAQDLAPRARLPLPLPLPSLLPLNLPLLPRALFLVTT